MVNIYCQDCQSFGCLLCADQQSTHAGHEVLTLPQAADFFKVCSSYQLYQAARLYVKPNTTTSSSTAADSEAVAAAATTTTTANNNYYYY